jgi:hypothetical protein
MKSQPSSRNPVLNGTITGVGLWNVEVLASGQGCYISFWKKALKVNQQVQIGSDWRVEAVNKKDKGETIGRKGRVWKKSNTNIFGL